MSETHNWPRGPKYWNEGKTLFVSIPFTWSLPTVKKQVNGVCSWEKVIVGGPAVDIMPGYFDGMEHVTAGGSLPGVLQRVNPLATRTTTGCTRRCSFCAIGKGQVEPGGMVELEDWPDFPILCDNNILATSEAHFNKVIERLKVHGWADFNQGIDARLLTKYHAKRLKEIGRPMIRLALDNMGYIDDWQNALTLLRSAGFPLSLIRSYALIGFKSAPSEAWARCEWIEKNKIKALPMWYHPLDAMQANKVSPEQERHGWTDYERRKIMQWFYQHKEAVA